MKSTRSRAARLTAIGAVGLLALAGCEVVDEEPNGTGNATSGDETTDDETADGDDSTDDDTDSTDDGEATDDPAGGEVNFGDGVTAEACPDAVNPDNGCIYLGILSDLTEGPFAALAVPITEAQQNYWQQVNEAGGIGGFDIDVNEYTRDTKYQPAEHAAAYNAISPHILAIAQSLGTVNTEAVLDDMDANDIVAVPASWWSGYHFEENDKGLIMETGYSYCVESVVGLDWYTENHAEPTTIAAVGYPGDYGGDSAAGAELWAEQHGAEVTVVPTGPNQVTGNQDAVVGAVLQANPDVVILAVGPAENAEIVGKLAASGYQGRFLGSLPTWNPALLQSAAAPALQAMYNHMAPSQSWNGDSEGVARMQESLGGEEPANAGYIIGWMLNYPMHALLEKAVDTGDLTRAGLRAAIDGLETDFQGMAQNITYGGEGKDVAVSGVIIGTPSPDAPLGLDAALEFYEGSTFGSLDYTQACSASS